MTLASTLSETRSHRTIVRRERTWSHLYCYEVTLGAILKLYTEGGGRMEAWRPIKRLLSKRHW